MHRPGAAGIPLLGMYSSFHPGVVRQHAFWMVEAGVNCILVDWSNNLWGGASSCNSVLVWRVFSSSLKYRFSGTPWDARSRGVQELVNATSLALRTYSRLRAEGHDVPRAIIMIGLQNGPPADPKALGDESQWIYDNFVHPLGADAFVSLPNDHLPLLIVLACGMGEAPNASVTQIIGRDLFTIRYMSTQLQENPDLGLKKGFWSWMDGTAPLLLLSRFKLLTLPPLALSFFLFLLAQEPSIPFPPCGPMTRARPSLSRLHTLLEVVGSSHLLEVSGAAALWSPSLHQQQNTLPASR